jgi:rsbT co-antagonist protein RsbR
MPEKNSMLLKVLKRHEQEILAEWIKELGGLGVRRDDRTADGELPAQCAEFLRFCQQALQGGDAPNVQDAAWTQVRDVLSDLSRARAVQGFSPRQTAMFVFALKKPLFDHLRKECAKDPDQLADEVWYATELLDTLGLMTTEFYQRSREEVIVRQQQDLLELSTPVVKVWDGILVLPMIGTLDSARTQVVMETLLERVVETGAEIAIIDITGVPTVDTLVAQHLLKAVTAARLMGADCIISGIRPQIAQTIVHLGVELKDVITKASLADALKLAMRKIGLTVHKQTA